MRLTATATAVAALSVAILAGCGGDSQPAAAPSAESAATTGASTAAVTPATSSPTTTVPLVHVTWEQHAPPITIDAPVCDGQKACLYPYRQDAVAAGDVDGSALTAGGAAVPSSGKPNTYATIMTSVLTGRFASCGSGTAVVRRVETVDPESGASSGGWEIVPGYGTGDLAGLTGSGEIVAGTPTSATDQAARFIGDVSCSGNASGDLLDTSGGSPITSHAKSDVPTLSAPVCDAAQSCLWPTIVRERSDGDLQGTTIQVGAGRLSGDAGSSGYAATAVELFRGSVTGCGDGTMVVRSTSELAGTTLTQTWEIVPGFGSGTLATARGSGTSTASHNADGTYVGDGEGHITCG